MGRRIDGVVGSAVEAVLALGSQAVSARGAAVHQAAATTGGPLLIGILAGLGVVILAVFAFVMMRAYRLRSRTIESIRRLIQDADAALRDPVLVHQARRRIRSTRFGRH
jgi:hypothetical protein